MEVRTKGQEMQAAELRLSHMEQDMVEMSTQNETYRSQVMNLTTQVDIAETQMRALRDQESWIGNDVQVSFFVSIKGQLVSDNFLLSSYISRKPMKWKTLLNFVSK